MDKIVIDFKKVEYCYNMIDEAFIEYLYYRNLYLNDDQHSSMFYKYMRLHYFQVKNFSDLLYWLGLLPNGVTFNEIRECLI